MACISDNSDELLRSRIEDTVRLCDKRGVPCFLGFLDLHEQSTAQRVVSILLSADEYVFYGGYDDAERKMLAVFPPYCSAEMVSYPFERIAFSYRRQKKLTHRDVLGTLMSLGIRRDAVGDILCGDGLSVVFIRSEMVHYVREQVERIGGEGVSVIAPYEGMLPCAVEYAEIRGTIASARLDSIVKALIRCSREQASELIRSDCVSMNHQVVSSISKPVSQGATISVRGYGRFIIDQIGPETKKGRLMFKARRRL